MLLCAKDGASLDQCVSIASSACKHAERACPRTGPGRKPDVPDWVVAVMVIVGVMHRKKSRAAQYAFWKARDPQFGDWFPGERILSRAQFYERARRLGALLRVAIQRLGAQAVQHGWADAESVAVDKSLVAARGRKRSVRQTRLPRGVDPDATWGYSEHDGWVFGYAYEVVVSAGKRGALWPLLASVDTASRSEQKTCLEKFVHLPSQTRYVLADAGYDSNVVGETVEWTAEGRSTGRRFLCPQIPRPQVGRPRRSHSRETRQRQHHRRLRDARRKFTQSPRGRCLYRRRSVTVEPFHSRLKHAFELHDRVWHWRLENNRVTILAAIAAYQTLLTYNHQKRRRHARIQYLLNPW
jgi:DDE family transposase